MVGDKNWYQIRLLLVLALQWTVSAFIIMIQPFLNQVPTFECLNRDGQAYDCNEEQAIDQGRCYTQYISSNSPQSMVRDLGLYCQDANLRSFGVSMFFIGGSVGSVIFLYLADIIGRYPVLFISYLLGTIFTFLLGTVNTWYFYYICISLNWAGFDPYFALSTVVVNEQGGASSEKLNSV